MTVLHTDIDPYCCAVLRKNFPHDEVLEKDIREIQPEDVAGYDTVHWFAGIGGWSLALRYAGYAGPCWTVSCPCQPFSAAGRAGGVGDERHLWPVVRGLIAVCRPSVIFGEQVASSLGYQWLAGVRLDLEREGYAVGCADLPAACVGAPHIRQRIFFVANSDRHKHCRARRTNGKGADYRWRPSAEGVPTWAGGFDELVAMDVADRISSYAEARRALDGIPARVDRLRGLGNAIVPQVAAVFVRAWMQTERLTP